MRSIISIVFFITGIYGMYSWDDFLKTMIMFGISALWAIAANAGRKN